MQDKKYTHNPIKGKEPAMILPKGYSLVLEGGGMRGFYSAGVFEAFMDAGIMFPYVIGVSAGAANALSYISGQPKRNRQVVEFYANDKRYVGKRNLLLHRSLFNMEFVFHTVPKNHIYMDWEMFKKQNIRFLTGAMDCMTGKTVWFEKHHIKPSLETIIASCSMPMVSKIVRYKGFELLDGGVSDPIPIEKSIADGNKFHVIVLTRNKGYSKTAFKHTKLLKLLYPKYPKMVESVLNRHKVYKRQLKLAEQLEIEGKAIIIRPQNKLQVERTAKDIKKLLELYDEGHEEGKNVIHKILKNI